MEEFVDINGEFFKPEEAKISVFDHGFLYGDGIFEGIKAYNGRIFKLEEHINRLFMSAKALMLNIPGSKEEIADMVLETCRKSDVRKDAYIRLIISRGAGGMGLDPRNCNSPTVVVIITPLIRIYEEKIDKGVKLVTTSYRRMSPECLSPNIKSLNYLNNIMGKIDANLSGADEALFLDQNAHVAEATADNIFAVQSIDHRQVVTTPPTIWNLKGITRATALEIAKKLGYDIRVTPIGLFDIYNADEVFITGTAAEIAPVTEVDGRVIGDGKPGKTSMRLREEYLKLVNSTGTPIWDEK